MQDGWRLRPHVTAGKLRLGEHSEFQAQGLPDPSWPIPAHPGPSRLILAHPSSSRPIPDRGSIRRCAQGCGWTKVVLLPESSPSPSSATQHIPVKLALDIPLMPLEGGRKTNRQAHPLSQSCKATLACRTTWKVWWTPVGTWHHPVSRLGNAEAAGGGTDQGTVLFHGALESEAQKQHTCMKTFTGSFFIALEIYFFT